MSGLGPKLLCRADIAVLLSLTLRQVARNEARLGIRPYRVVINAKTIRYHLAETLNALKQRGWIR
jgi:hypothetical protein